MEEHSIYVVATGHFTGARIALWPFDAAELARLTPPGCATEPGAHDHRACRKDIATGAVVPYAPPVDAAQVLSTAKQVRLHAVDAQLAEHDRQAIRPAGEIAQALATAAAVPQAALDRLIAINDAKAVLRATRAAVVAAPTLDALAAIA